MATRSRAACASCPAGATPSSSPSPATGRTAIGDSRARPASIITWSSRSTWRRWRRCSSRHGGAAPSQEKHGTDRRDRKMLRSVALPRDRIVLIFARAPRDERRAKPLADGAPAAAVEALHDRLLQRTMAVARASGVATRLVTTAETRSCGGAAELDVVLQQGATFAERLENAVADAFAAGFGDVVVVGADTPALEPKHLRRAFGELAAARGPCAVVGPACDGGYYLLALNAFCAAAFRRVPLGTARAFGATVDALEHAGFAVATLPPLRDVDDGGDV